VGKTDSPGQGVTRLDPAADPSLWLAAEPADAPSLKVAAARAFLRRAARRCGVQLRFPDGTSFGPTTGPVMSIRDYHALAARLATSGEIGFGEAYMAGDWDSPDLVGLLEAILRGIWTVVPRPLAILRRLTQMANPHHQDNDLGGARRNVAQHYDLSNELFAQFLDETMTYSAALFEHESDSLAVAQGRKIDRLLDATGVGPAVRLLEIGTGWGELALRAGRRNAQVTTITLSHQQAELTRRRVAAAGLERRVEVRVQDYRQVTGTFDAIISVEMIEAVGRSWWPTYLHSLDQHLAAGGRVGLQSILMDHHRMLDASRSWTWTRKYVFPGGVIPSQTAIEASLTRHTTLRLADNYHFGASYARTLGEWRHRFTQRRDQLHRLGFDSAFQRMWNYYLAQSQAAFQAGYLDVAQLILTHTEAKPPRNP
jgi:cyclopropane-fatty-acyl-phospholipid synthase